MKTQRIPHWKPARNTISLKQACQQALHRGAQHIHFAGHTEQPCVVIPLQTWLHLIALKNKRKP